jgi:serine/threonine protein phosphatase PrpC
VKLRFSTFEHPGSSERASQDRLAITPLDDDGLLCVLSDGVGTARDPERCAERVVRLVADNFSARPRQWPMRRLFGHLADRANKSLLRKGFYLDGTVSMQATLAVTCLRGKRNPNTPAWLECVIEKSLHLNQKGRYQCCSELFFALSHPEAAPWGVRRGPLLESNPLRFYRVAFWVLLASTVLLIYCLCLLCHR